MGFLTVIPGGLLAPQAKLPNPSQVLLENHVRELLLDLYCTEIGVTVREALAVIRDCCLKKSSLATSPWVRFSSALNAVGIFVEIAAPDEDLDVPLYLFVMDTPKLLAAYPELAEFKLILQEEIEFG